MIRKSGAVLLLLLGVIALQAAAVHLPQFALTKVTCATPYSPDVSCFRPLHHRFGRAFPTADG